MSGLPSDGNGDFCGGCPTGTVCAPTPCLGESCAPSFSCIANNPGASASCTFNPECNCPGGVCYDCPAGQYCTIDRRCDDLCAPGVTVAACCGTANLRTPALACCGPNETFDAQSGTCQGGCPGCAPACNDTEFCERSLCRCLPKGG
jgi:hypothetical protein